jgi:hypothetical protein
MHKKNTELEEDDLPFAVKPEGCVLLSLCKGDEALMLSEV